MILSRKFIFFCIFFLSLQVSHAQEVDNIPLKGRLVRISFWRKSHGLPTWHIRDLIQDNRGMIWMATDQGLVSLNGKKFKIHEVPIPEIKAKDLYRLLMDKEHRLWLFYHTGDSTSICVYDPIQGQVEALASYIGRSLSFSSIALSTLCKVRDTIWILDPGTRRGGYYAGNNRWTETFQDTVTHEESYMYFPASAGKIWMVNKIMKAVYLSDAFGNIKESYSIKDSQISSYWVGHCGTLYFIYPSEEKRGSDSPVSILKCVEGVGVLPVIAQDQFNLEWGNGMSFGYNSIPIRSNNQMGIELVIHENGFDLYDKGKLLYKDLDQYLQQEHRLKPEKTIYVLEDQSFWMLAIDAIIRLEVLPNYFTNYLQEVENPPSTRGLEVMGDTLYVNSYQGHLAVNLLNKRWRKMTELNRYPLGLGMAVYKDKLWSGHHGNMISVYSPIGNRCKFIPILGDEWNYQTNAFFFNDREGVFLGTAFGLFKYHSDSQVFRKTNNNYPQINCFYKNTHGIWMGSSEGLFLLDSLSSHLDINARHIFPLIITTAVKQIYEDKEGVFWLATAEGLWRWRPFSMSVDVFNEATVGLPSNQIHAIYEDHLERLWMSSDNGIICFDKKSQQFHTFTVGDGLSSNEFNYLSHCRDEQGRLYFGSVSGVTSFQPDSINKNSYNRLKLYLTAFKIRSANTSNEQNLTIDANSHKEPLKIAYSTEQISIEFYAPVFSGECIQYRWRISKFDSTWTILTEPHINIFQPHIGAYTIEIEASVLGNNLIPKASFYIDLIVEDPFYLNTDYLVFGAILISGLIVGVFRWRQQRLQHLSKRLSKEVAEKTIQLQQERDTIAKQAEELKCLDEEKSRFFQDLSHEIRNPLTLILGPVSELLKQEELPESYREKLERVKRNTRKIMALIEEVLELTRLEAGVVPLEHSEFILEALLERLVGEFELRAGAEGKALRLAHHFPDGLMIRTDMRKLEKVISNLIDNALKYTPAGGVVLVQARWQEEGVLRLEVRDTGVGIAGEHLGRIFNRYYQVPGVEALGRKGGFGIGLAMCRSYMQLLGGEITAESTPGAGTAMRLVLPCGEVKSAVVMKELDRTEPAGRCGRILVVDDEPEILNYVTSLLSDRHEVIRAGSGEEAWSILAREKVELVISDLVMPEGGGLELLSRIRGGGINQATPFLMLTGFHSSETLLEAARLGCNGHLIKPVEEEEFLMLVNELLQIRIAE